MQDNFEIIIIGSGHNALIAACYLAKAGRKVLVLEKNDYIGGATTSQKVFTDYEAYLSRYSYLVSLIPDEIIRDLELNIELKSRKFASYTPYFQNGKAKGLLISNEDENLSRESFLELTGDDSDWQGYQELLKMEQEFAEEIWDSMLLPLKSKSDWKKHFEAIGKAEVWKAFVEKPIGEIIEEKVKSDVLRGVLLTDAKIGAYTHAHDKSLLQNRTFIYHIIGQKTGEWKVPVGGMGKVAEQIRQKAKELGVEFRLNAKVDQINPGENNQVIVLENSEKLHAPIVLLNAAIPKFIPEPESEQNIGTAFKINLLLEKLPELKDDSVKPEDAFSGTFHINQNYSQQEKAFLEASSGKIPETFPCEIYCHTITDNSILSEVLKQKGFHTITVFGLDMAYPLFVKDNESVKKLIVEKFLKGINAFLEIPLEDCLAKDKNGHYCIEAKSALDLERDLGMPKGNIFHNQLSWFYATNEQEIGKWGVETKYPGIFLCGSTATRGGAVSGIPGRYAAIAVLEFISGF